GDVLADFIADPRAVDVAAGAHATEGRVAARPDVAEVVAEGHVLAVGLGGGVQVRVGRQRALPVAGPFAVDEAQGGGANPRDVVLRRREVGVEAGAAVGGGRAVGAVRGNAVAGVHAPAAVAAVAARASARAEARPPGVAAPRAVASARGGAAHAVYARTVLVGPVERIDAGAA